MNITTNIILIPALIVLLFYLLKPNTPKIILSVVLIALLFCIFTSNRKKNNIIDETFMTKTKGKNFGLLLPGCAFGSLLTQTGYIRSIFNNFRENGKLGEFLNPSNTVVSACSGGHFSYPYFDGRDPFNLLGEYIEPQNMILPDDKMTVSKGEKLEISPGELIERYNLEFSVKQLKQGDNKEIYENKDMLWWDRVVKIWYNDIEKERKNMAEIYSRPEFVSSMVGIVKSKETLADYQFKYLIYNDFNYFDDKKYKPLILDLKNEEKYNSIKYEQEMRPTDLAASAMNLWGILYDHKECNADNNGYSNCYFECSNGCQDKDKDKEEKNLKGKVIDYIVNSNIKKRIFNKARIYPRNWEKNVPIINNFLGDNVDLTDAGVVDLNTIIFQLQNQTQNMLFCNINSCNLKGYFVETGDTGICSIINKPLFDGSKLEEMEMQFSQNFKQYGVEFAILEDVYVKDNKRFSITEYTIKKLFIVNFKPSIKGSFKDTDWWKKLNKSTKDYINKKNDKGQYYLEAGCQGGRAQQIVPGLKDSIIISNYTCWQMNQILNDKRVQVFFSMFD